MNFRLDLSNNYVYYVQSNISCYVQCVEPVERGELADRLTGRGGLFPTGMISIKYDVADIPVYTCFVDTTRKTRTCDLCS